MLRQQFYFKSFLELIAIYFKFIRLQHISKSSQDNIPDIYNKIQS